MDDLLTVKQVMDLLQVDRTTVYRMINDGRLTGVKIGQQWRFSRGEVESFVSGVADEIDSPDLSVSSLPIHCVQPIQDVFAEIAAVGSVTTAPDGEPITSISNSCRFCNIVLSSASGRRACVSSWRRLADQKVRGPEFVTCHAGLQYARARIEIGSGGHELTAMLIAGQFYARPADRDDETRRVREIADRHDLDAAQLSTAGRQISVLDDRYRDRIGNWLEKVAQTLAAIGRERADLMGRLDRIARESQLGSAQD